MLGRFVAELVLAEEGPIRAERTTREAGHHTLWGDPDELLRCVSRVEPARATAKQENSA